MQTGSVLLARSWEHSSFSSALRWQQELSAGSRLGRPCECWLGTAAPRPVLLALSHHCEPLLPVPKHLQPHRLDSKYCFIKVLARSLRLVIQNALLLETGVMSLDVF